MLYIYYFHRFSFRLRIIQINTEFIPHILDLGQRSNLIKRAHGFPIFNTSAIYYGIATVKSTAFE